MRACLGLLVVLSLAPLRQSEAQTLLHRDPVSLQAVLPASTSYPTLPAPASAPIDSARHHGVGHAALVDLGIGTGLGLVTGTVVRLASE
ncbi:MAG TPA: hypothetical protein VFI41_06080 [Gemmatimonadales bacterium]|nr:hypothetical protein [Gemmatimonadales bacterium]